VSQVLDVLGAEIPLPDPDAIQALADHYGEVAGEIGAVSADLEAAHGAEDWQGAAADAFRNDLGDLPGELAKAHNSYAGMQRTVSSYAGSIRAWVGQVTSVAAQADEVGYELSQAETALRAAQAGNQDTSALEGRIGSLQDELDQLRGRISDLVNSQLPALAGACVQGIRQAQDAGIQNSFWGWVDQYVVHDVLGTIGGGLEDAGSFVDNAVLKPIASIPGDLVALAGDVASGNWGKALQDLSTTLGDLGTLVGVASLLIPGLGEVLLPAAVAMDAAHIADDGVLVAEGKKGWSALVFDGVALAGDGAGAFSHGASVADDQVRDLSKEGSDAFDSAASLEAAGLDGTPKVIEGLRSYVKAYEIGTQSGWRAALGLGKEGGAAVLTFKAMRDGAAWKGVASDLMHPSTQWLSDLRNTYLNLGVSDVASPASALLHRITGPLGWATSTAGLAYGDAQAQGS
jgi:hypothetical protein